METFSALLAICAGSSPVPGEFPAKRPVTRSFDVSLICAPINGWINNGKAGDLRRYRVHCDVIVMRFWWTGTNNTLNALLYCGVDNVNTLGSRDAYMYRLIMSVLIWIIGWGLNGAKPLSEPMMSCQLDPWEIKVNKIKIHNCKIHNCIRKCRWWNVHHFVPGLIHGQYNWSRTYSLQTRLNLMMLIESSQIHYFLWKVSIHPSPNFNGGVT